MPFARELWIEFRADPVVPPTPLGNRHYHRQSVRFELFDEGRIVGEPRYVDSMQIEHNITVFISLNWLENVARMATDGFFGPCPHSESFEQNVRTGDLNEAVGNLE